MQLLLELQWVSSRLQCVLLDFAEVFMLRILTTRQFAAGMVAAAPYYMSVVKLSAAVGGSTNRSLSLPSTSVPSCAHGSQTFLHATAAAMTSPIDP